MVLDAPKKEIAGGHLGVPFLPGLYLFSAATGTKAIYGVNLKLGNVNRSAAEAAYVMSKYPSRIVTFEIGTHFHHTDQIRRLPEPTRFTELLDL